MRKLYLALLTVLIISLTVICAFAEGTRTWLQSSFEDFEKGTAKGVAIRSDGSIELAPNFKLISTTPSTYIWALASDTQGNTYAAAGSPARVYRITPDGQSSVIFQPAELQVQSLIVDAKGVIYAATSPDGKIYKIEHHSGEPKQSAPASPIAKGDGQEAQPAAAVEKTKSNADPNWTASVFFEPKTKYIWALALDNDGRLYVATGDRGEIFRVEKDGKGSLFFKSDEAHIRALALDHQGNVIAGSDGSGLVYRISPGGEAFVLYSAAKKEVTALAIDAAGNIYASAVGEKRAGGSPSLPTTGAAMAAPSSAGGSAQGAQGGSSAAPVMSPPPNFPIPGLNAIGGSDVYKIAPDGSPTRLWASQTDVVYALGLDQNNNLIAGTGNRGRIFSIRDDQDFTDLVKASATQITAFAKAPNGGLYVSTSNFGKVFLLGGSPEAEGSFESDVFDAHNFSRWGRSEVRATGAIELWARSGNVDNPDRNWSAWKKVDLARETPMTVPPARFIQWKAELRPGSTTPRIDSVQINYLPKNVAPKVEDVSVIVGFRTPAARTLSDSLASGGPNSRSESSAPTPVREKGSIAVKWSARDENDDQLVYSLYYRGDGEKNWKLLKDKLIDRFYSFDAGLLPDGGYTIKIVASDAPSHSPEEALTDERESNRFEVDTTPPQVQNLNAAAEGDQLHITFRAIDGFSTVRRAEYSVDAGEWQYVEPIGQLSDYRIENYDFAIPVPGGHNGTVTTPASDPVAAKAKTKRASAPVESGNRTAGEHLVVVRVYDKFDNVGVAKVVVQGK